MTALIMTSQSDRGQEVKKTLSLQQCLVLTAATGAVWMDLRTEEIENGWIVTIWIAGLLTGWSDRGVPGILFWLAGITVPLLGLFWLFLFRMLGAGDIKLFSALGGILGPAAIVKCICLSFIFGAILSIGILVICGNIRQRLFKLTTYIRNITGMKLQRRTSVPVPYRSGKHRMEYIHFSVPILLSVLLWLGGVY